jgi:hypothetical protein
MRNVFKVIICFLIFKVRYTIENGKSTSQWHVKYYMRIPLIYFLTILLSPILVFIGGYKNVTDKFKKDHFLKRHVSYHLITLARNKRLSLWDCYIIF